MEESDFGGVTIDDAAETSVAMGKRRMLGSEKGALWRKEPRFRLTVRMPPDKDFAAEAANATRSGVLRISDADGRRTQWRSVSSIEDVSIYSALSSSEMRDRVAKI